MHSFDKTFRDLLIQAVENLADEKKGELAHGGWARSVADAATVGAYALERIGYLRALDQVLKFCDEIEDKLNRG